MWWFVSLLGALILCLLTLARFKRHQNITKNIAGKASVLIVMGSGGHTSELVRLVECLKDHYEPRYYVIANTDQMSEDKVKQLQDKTQSQYEIIKIPRSRAVKQSWFTTVLSTLYATLYSFPVVFTIRPDAILCNGPGTCIPVCIAGYILKIVQPLKIIYVESICRVTTLSLSGRILYNFADHLIVQWPSLQKKYPKTLYFGRLG